MLEINTFAFLALVACGAFVQTITGFAMGLLIMAGVAVLGIADIAFSAAVVSFISFINAIIALRSGYKHIEWRYVTRILAGLIPSMIVGIVMLTYLSLNFYLGLRMLLGVVIVLAGILLMLAPSPFSRRSSGLATSMFGILGGILTGLYSAGGAPLAYFMYRQPMEINTIRFTLLSVFALSTAIRAGFAGVAGMITIDVLYLSALSIPVVIVVTLAAARLSPPDKIVRWLVFMVLLLVGGFLVVDSTSALYFA